MDRERLKTQRLGHLCEGFVAFSRDERQEVLEDLRRVLSNLPSQDELISSAGNAVNKQQIVQRYQVAAVRHARRYDPNFDIDQTRESSAAAGAYKAFFRMIVGFSKEKISLSMGQLRQLLDFQ